MTAPRIHLENDWYPLGLPGNVTIGEAVYIDSSYGFAAFNSVRQPGLVVGRGSGIYDRAALVVDVKGQVTIGEFSVLNGTYIVSAEDVSVADHCLLSWGVVITDNWAPAQLSLDERRNALRRTAANPLRPAPIAGPPRPTVIEDNVWVGFDAVILAGVRLGRGCIVGCRSVVHQDVPPYAVVAGDPASAIRPPLEPDDTIEARERALAECARVYPL